MRTLISFAGAAALVAAIPAYGQTRPAAPSAVPNPPAATAPPSRAVAHLVALGASGVTGTVTFTQTAGSMQIMAALEGLTPGKHGFHVHEFGDCSEPAGMSAGGHFNPAGAPHAGHGAAPRHGGDLGNIEAGADGKATLTIVDSELRFDGPLSVLGRGLIVHAKEDDLATQPTGNAGGRVACGVIGVVKP